MSELTDWLTQAGLDGCDEAAILTEVCTRLRAAGLPLGHAIALVDTLHPVHEGRALRWYHDRDEGRATLLEYGRTTQGGAAAESWQRSSYHQLYSSGGTLLRRRLDDPATLAEFPGLTDLRAAGLTDYAVMISRFAPAGSLGELDCIFFSWASDRPEGFAEADIALLQNLVPSLALAMKSVALVRIAATLVETYLGRDAGRRVLEGRIGRGVAERIDAVLWFSDLQGYTKITDTAPPEQIVPLLDDYAEAVINAVTAKGGDVLKLIGDGVLAIFRAETRAAACRNAIKSALILEDCIAHLNRERQARGLPTTQAYLGLHVGEVFFGNIGSPDRLDFTVVGPAVNEVSRIAAMCRSADRPLLVSAAFARALAEAEPLPNAPRLVSVGRYALRGVRESQELFTLEAERG